MKFLCKILGHDIDDVLLCMHKVENSAINRANFIGNTLKCSRCGKILHTIKK